MTVHSSLASVAATKQLCEQWGISTKKNLGQHFLIDDNIVGKILQLADIAPNSKVVEVGPGIGTLSLALLSTKCNLTVIEADKSLQEYLDKLCSKSDNLQLVYADALQFDLNEIYSDDFQLVANLPYNIAATLVLDYFIKYPQMTSATIMVQSEVSDRMKAQVGSKDYGAYTLKLQYLAKVTGSFKVSRTAFYPPPRVDSKVIRLERRTEAAMDAGKYEMYADVVNAAFYQRRKTILNSFRAYYKDKYSEADLARIFKSAHIDPVCRGESLAASEFISLACAFQTNF